MPGDVRPTHDHTCTTMPFGNHGGEVELWDTSQHKSAVDLCRRAGCVIFVYDVTKKETLQGLERWVDMLRKIAGSKISVALIGNKVDLVEKDQSCRQISFESGETLQEQLGLIYFAEVSATPRGSNTVESIASVFNQIITAATVMTSVKRPLGASNSRLLQKRDSMTSTCSNSSEQKLSAPTELPELRLPIRL